MRVEALGGKVEWNAVNGELEVSRSVVCDAPRLVHSPSSTTPPSPCLLHQGDLRMETGRKLLGLSAEPKVQVRRRSPWILASLARAVDSKRPSTLPPTQQVHYLTDDDEFIIIACDGLW